MESLPPELDQDFVRELSGLKGQVDGLALPEVMPDVPPLFRFAMFQYLTGLRGLWPMSAFDSAGNALDQSGNERTLTRVGNPVYDYDGFIPYIRFDGTGDYLLRADEAGLDITGAEAYVGTPGLTVFGWFRPEDIINGQGLISKWAPAADLSYMLSLSGDVAGDPINFFVSDDGANFDTVQSTSAYVANAWQWMAGRFNDADAGAELAIWLGDEMTTAATARNAIFSGAADFNISGFNNGSNLYTGRASMCALYAAALSDVIIEGLFAMTRGIFGV